MMFNRKPAAFPACLLFIGAMVFTPCALGDSLDHDSVKRLRDEGRILPMFEVMRRAERIQPGQLLEAELEREDGRYVYEIRILDPAGRVHELEFDAASGVLIESSYDD
ncbi:MAG: PepSY domain-containing protein [Lamprobacter sp.]|uniref:PepSY domain-containing protein n=1 Tax=Lamprobacter sp. TaxID=3100796 RepID=UPI002B25AA4F|nr:PepSY domain-containing protein [Lamprobacter sp.]MEA3641965.1 PepSY domain-containing protein [Lamprobacter sp.]